MADVFISYSRKDKAFVRRLDEALKEREREAWVDWEGIQPTEEFMQAIYAAIEGADTFIFVLSPDSISSVICGKEIAHAVTHNKRMVPLVVRDVNAAEVPETLAKLNWILCRDSEPLDEVADTLVSVLDTDLDWVRAHTRLLTRAVEWEAKGKHNSFVLRGVDLRAAEKWLTEAGTEKERQPTALQTEYIIASRRAETSRQRTILTWVGVAAVIAVVLALIAFRQSRLARAKEVEAQKTFSQSDFLRASELLVQNRSSDALAFLARACRTDPGNREAATRLFSLLLQRNWIMPITAPLWHPDEEGSNRTIEHLSFHPAGTVFVSTTFGDAKARVWDARTGRLLLEPLPCNSTSYDYDSRPLLPRERSFSTRDPLVLIPVKARVQIADYRTGKVRELTGTGEFTVAQFSKDGASILTADQSGSVTWWDAATGHPLEQLFQLPGRVSALSEDGTQAVTEGSSERAGQETAANRGFEVWELGAPGDASIRFKTRGQGKFLAMSGDGKWIAASMSQGEEQIAIRFLDVASDTVRDSRLGNTPPGGEFISDFTFTPDGRFAVSSSCRFLETDLIPNLRHTSVVIGQTRVWEVATGEQISRVAHGVRLQNYSEGYHPYRASIDSFGVRAASLAFEDRSLKVFASHGGSSVNEPPSTDADFSALAFHPSGRYLLAGSIDGAVRIWDVQRTSPIWATMRIPATFESARFSRDGNLVALTTGFSNGVYTGKGRTICFDVRSGEAVEPVPEEFSKPDPNTEDASGQRKFVAIDAKDEADEEAPRHLVDTITGEPLAPEIKLIINDHARFSSNGEHLLLVRGQGEAPPLLFIMNAKTGTLLREPILGIYDAWFSPKADRVLLKKEGALTVIDLTTGRELIDPLVFGDIRAAAFTEHGIIAVERDDSEAVIHRFQFELDQAPALLPDLAETLGQRSLNKSGVPEANGATVVSLRAAATRLDPSPVFTGWLEWFLAPRESRPIGPGAKMTMAEYLSLLIERGTSESLGEAELLALDEQDWRNKIDAKRALLPSKEESRQ